ncbi:MAG: hypothetical protein KJ072_23875, partial [Verrucomicrobia bacterium]|nr:hypothetical protein [Verrucomicrobiota bacterium]
MKNHPTLFQSGLRAFGCAARRFHLFSSLLLLFVAVGAQAQTVARWKSGSGSWSDPNQWDIGVVPKNAGATTYVAVLDLPTEDGVVTVTEPITISGLVNRELLRIEVGGNLTLSGGVTNRNLAIAATGTLNLSGATVDGTGGTFAADGGIIGITGSTLNGGTLRATDNPASAVRFSGDVTFNSVPWDDPGAGEFQIVNTTARLLGDYATQLPTGYTLVVWRTGSWTPAQLTLPGGDFLNNGLILLRDSGGGYRVYARLHWEASGTLAGNGEVIMSGGGDGHLWTAAEGAVVTIGPNQWVHGWGELQMPVVNQGTVEADLSGGTLRFTQPLENTGTLHALGGGSIHLAGGLNDTGAITLEGAGTLTLNGAIATDHDWTVSTGGALSIVNADVTLNGRTFAADGGIIGITGSTLNG